MVELEKEQLDIIISFTEQHYGCEYTVVINGSDTVLENYCIRHGIAVILEKEIQQIYKLNMEDFGCGSFMIKNFETTPMPVIYIKLPYPIEKTEYTLKRTLTHEYGHYLQYINKGACTQNCNGVILEYHNIMFHEFGKIREINHKVLPQTIDKEGYRLRYQWKFKTPSIYSFSFFNFFESDFNNFCTQIYGTEAWETTDAEYKLLNNIFESFRNEYQYCQNPYENKYMILFYNFIKDFRSSNNFSESLAHSCKH